MRYVMLIIATMLVATPLGAQGWRVETTTGFEHVQYLAVESKEANATLSVWCGVDRPSVGIDLAPGVGIFNFTTLDNASATTRERFLPDSTIVSTLWSVNVSSGHANSADSRAGQPWAQDEFLQRLARAHTLQVDLNIYARENQVATFRIPNHDALESFLASCQKGASGMVLSGNEVFMEAIVEEKPAVLSGSTLQFPELLRQAGIAGRVLVQAIVDTLGRAEPNSVKVLQSPNPGFDQSATNYVLKALFRPARVHGRAVRVLIQIPVDFRKY